MFAESRHHPVTTALLVVLFWLGAAVLVCAVHLEIDPRSVVGGAAGTIVAVFAAAHLYTRLCARNAGVSHALGVGVAWLVLAISTEIAVSSRLGHDWYAMLGTPAHPLLRNLFLFVWVFAPVCFAHREVGW